MGFLYFEYFGNPLLNWLIALLTFLLVFLILFFVRGSMLNRLRARAASSSTDTDDVFIEVLSKTRLFGILALAVYLSSLVLVLSPNATVFLRTAMIILMLIQLAIWGNSLVTVMVTREVHRRVRLNEWASLMCKGIDRHLITRAS